MLFTFEFTSETNCDFSVWEGFKFSKENKKMIAFLPLSIFGDLCLKKNLFISSKLLNTAHCFSVLVSFNKTVD